MKTQNETISDTADYFDCQNERHSSPTRPPEQHSPLPWQVWPNGLERDVYSTDGFKVATCQSEARPSSQSILDAAYIVKAANEYPKLLAQRDELLAALTETALNRQDKIDWVKINKLIPKCEAQP